MGRESDDQGSAETCRVFEFWVGYNLNAKQETCHDPHIYRFDL